MYNGYIRGYTWYVRQTRIHGPVILEGSNEQHKSCGENIKLQNFCKKTLR